MTLFLNRSLINDDDENDSLFMRRTKYCGWMNVSTEQKRDRYLQKLRNEKNVLIPHESVC